jgi:cell wall-associated NlpC family hydrolase
MRFHHTLIAVSLLCSSAICLAADSAMQNDNPAASEQAHGDWSSMAQEILMNALSLTGIKYKYGGVSPETGFDCSGFVRYVFQQATDLTLPHGARALSQLGQAVPLEQLQPGDLVFFNTLKSAFSHVGIYLGNNRFIHAASLGGGIQVVHLDDEYWTKRFNGARRLDTAEVPAVEKPTE